MAAEITPTPDLHSVALAVAGTAAGARHQSVFRPGHPVGPMTYPAWLWEMCAKVSAANCGTCWARPGAACTTVHGMSGYHAARFGRAHRRGILTAAELDLLTSGMLPRAIVWDTPASETDIEPCARYGQGNRAAPSTLRRDYNVRGFRVIAIRGERNGQSGTISVWPIFDRQDWVNVAWDDGAITTAHPGDIAVPDEARQIERHAAVEARIVQLARKPKPDLVSIATKLARLPGGGSLNEYSRWSKDELTNEILRLEFPPDAAP